MIVIIKQVVKIGGSLFPDYAIDLADKLKNTSSVIILGGGEFANLIRKYDIEQEFKDLKFIHQHPISDNSNTIFKQTNLNGSFQHTFVVSLTDDLFISFNHDLFIPKSLSDFWLFYDENRSSSNILLDSRMTNYIAYATLKYEDDVLIYDVYSGTNISIYAFSSTFFNVQTNEMTIHLIKQLFIGYLLFVVFAKVFDFEWSTSTMIKQIKQKDIKINETKSTNISLFDVLINCAKVKTTTSISSKNVYYICSLFQKYFSESAFVSETAPNDILNEWKLNNIKNYEFLIALTVLKNNSFQFGATYI